MQSLKLDTTGYGSLLIPILKERLLDEINMIIARKFGGTTWTLYQVLEHFNDELKAQGNCTSVAMNKSNPYDKWKGGIFTASVLYAEARSA